MIKKAEQAAAAGDRQESIHPHNVPDRSLKKKKLVLYGVHWTRWHRGCTDMRGFSRRQTNTGATWEIQEQIAFWFHGRK